MKMLTEFVRVNDNNRIELHIGNDSWRYVGTTTKREELERIQEALTKFFSA